MFGRTFKDHMFQVEWGRSEGWKEPTIKPYGPLSLNPSASVFHYATEVARLGSYSHSLNGGICSVLRD